MTAIKSPKKLIEVALPLDDINREAAREKSIRHGHPGTLHLWQARRPLAAARAVLFAQMVNDPGYQQGGGFKYGVNKEEAARRREELFDIIRELVKWENTNNKAVLERARAEIRRSCRRHDHQSGHAASPLQDRSRSTAAPDGAMVKSDVRSAQAAHRPSSVLPALPVTSTPSLNATPSMTLAR